VKRFYVGTCGQVMGLKKMLVTYSALEINATFYRFPTEKQLRNWARVFEERRDFFLALKAYQGFTHPIRSPTWKRSGLSSTELQEMKDKVGCLRLNSLTEAFLKRTEELLSTLKADFLLFQLPSSCKTEATNLFPFLSRASKILSVPLGLEIRWSAPSLLEDCWRKLNVVPVFDPFLEPTLREIFFPELDFLYLRLHGQRDERGRLNYKYQYPEEELEELANLLIQSRAEKICVLFNNVYMKEDALRFLELLVEKGI